MAEWPGWVSLRGTTWGVSFWKAAVRWAEKAGIWLRKDDDPVPLWKWRGKDENEDECAAVIGLPPNSIKLIYNGLPKEDFGLPILGVNYEHGYKRYRRAKRKIIGQNVCC